MFLVVFRIIGDYAEVILVSLIMFHAIKIILVFF